MGRVLYLAHPVSAPNAAGIAENLARARRWLRWLVDHTAHAICCPWLPYVEVLPDDSDANRARGLRDDLAILERCDAIVLCGGRLSSGMSLEKMHALSHGLKVADLLTFGREPPRLVTVRDAIVQRNALQRLATELT